MERGVLLQAAEGSRTAARSVDQFFAFIFQLSRWALADVKGLQDPGHHVLPFLAQISLIRVSYVHVNILDRGLVPKPFGFSQLHPEAVNFVPGTTVLRTVTATYVFHSVLDSCSSPLQASA